MQEDVSILVTGGAGFIGSNLVEALLARKCRVTVLDNFSTGSLANLRPFFDDPRFRLIPGDIRDMAQCREAVKGVTYVLHEAALGSVPRSINDPMTSTAVNVLGTVNMLYAAKEAGVKRFVYAASSSAYGDSPALPKVEDVIGKPLSPYGISKYVGELFAANFHDIYGLDTIGLRYFNVFGRRQKPDGAYAAVIPKFIVSLLRHEAPTIHGDGEHSRDFTYVENVVRANLLALETENAAALNQVYNVACGGRMTLNELFAALREDLAAFDPAVAAIAPKYGPERQGDIAHSLASIEKAKRLLGYAPEFTAREGLKKTAEWYWAQRSSRSGSGGTSCRG